LHFRWNFGFHLNQILISYYQKFYENRIDSIKPLHAWNEHFRLKIRCFKKLLIPSTPKNRSERDWTGPCKYEPVSKQSKIFYWFTNMHKIKKNMYKEILFRAPEYWMMQFMTYFNNWFKLIVLCSTQNWLESYQKPKFHDAENPKIVFFVLLVVF